MSRHLRLLVPLVCLALTLALVGTVSGADWPTYRYDSDRTGVSPEQLAPKLQLQWAYASPHAPRPAWPEPGRELHRMAFDYAYQPVVADGVVYFGSSADHKLYALDLATGRERWTFFTGGPVRFAPAVADGRVFVPSDDGLLYCLSAPDGAPLWQFRPGPHDEMLFGNGRLMSRWPLRAGVAVADGTVYAIGGMWPSEGVFIHALRADDGSVVWTNDTSGEMYLEQPHPPSQGMTGVSPQGYVVVHEDQLFVPTGRNVPAAFDRATGELQYYRGRPDTWGDRWGGSYAFAVGDLLFNPRAHTGPDIDVRLGESDPWPQDGLVAFDRKTGQVKCNILNKHRAVLSGDVFYASGSGKVTAYDAKALIDGKKPEECTRWETPHERAYELVKAGDTLLVGGRGTVTAISATDGEVLWTGEVEGNVRGLAAADGRVLAGTDTGRIACFGPDPVPSPSTIGAAATAAVSAEPSGVGERIVADTGIGEGYCLLLGDDGALAQELAERTKLTLFCGMAAAGQVPAARETLDRAGLYGVRAVVHEADPDRLPYPDYCADLVVIASPEEWAAGEVYRVLRPCGGTAYVLDSEAAPAAGFRQQLKAAGALPGELRTDGNVLLVRGELPGAGSWTHQYADAGRSGCSQDSRAKVPLGLLWFGEPGPEKLVNRHWKGPAPLSVGGRLFVTGQHAVMAVDAYNGRGLWSRNLEGAGRFPVSAKGPNTAADEDSVYVAIGDKCHRLAAASGETIKTYEPPTGSPEGIWDYLAVAGKLVVGSVGPAGEVRRLFALDRDTGQALWTFDADRAIYHDAVALGPDAVYLLDATSAPELDKTKRRGELPQAETRLVGLDAETGQLLWETDRGLSLRTELRWAQGILLATGGGRMTAYSAADGDMLSWSGVNMRNFPVVVGDTIYGEPRAYDLRTGEPKMREHPLTGALVPWMFARSYGCGAVSGSLNLLMFRSGIAGFYDLATDSGTHNLGGVRAGCYVNTIAANGLLLMPPADAGCTCSYSFQATVALVPTERNEDWAVFTAQAVAAEQRMKSLALNLGAPGDRRDRRGTLWLGYPRPPTNQALQPRATVELAPGAGTYRHNADVVAFGGTDAPWLYASGYEGLQSLSVALGPGDPRSYTVRLHFAEPSAASSERRVFDVKLQGEPVLTELDVAREAGGPRQALMKEVKGVEAADTLKVELVPHAGLPPIINAIEVDEE